MRAGVARIRTAIANVKFFKNEPIALVGLGVEGLFLFQQARMDGLQIEDAAMAAVLGVLFALGRELVYPAAKVDAATGKAKEELEKPYWGEDQ